MSLEILKQHKVDEELKIIELDLLEVLPELKFSLEIPDVATRIDYSRSTLEKGHIILPVLEINTLLPIQYTHEKNGRVINTYPSFSNYVGYNIEYKRGDIMKIMFIEGVKVLKNSDEKFFDIVELKTTPLHFEYNFEQERWKKLDDIEIFEQKRNEIENAIRSKEIMSIIENYFTFRDTILDTVMKMRAKNPSEAPTYVLEQLQAVKLYHELQNVLGELTETNYKFISEQIEDVESFVLDIQKHLDEGSLSDYKLKDKLSDLRTGQLQQLLNVEGYWVDENETYPNLARFHMLKQQAASSRTPSNQRLLQIALFKHREKMNKLVKKPIHYVKDIHAKVFRDHIKEVEKSQV